MPAQRIGEEYPAKSGIIITPKKNPSGTRAWRVDIPATRTGEQREQRQFKNKEEAYTYASDRLNEIRRVGHSAFLLTASQRQDAAAAYELLSPYGISLTDAVKLAAKHLLPGNGRIALAELRRRFLAAPGRRRGCLLARKPRSMETMRLRTERFVEFAGSGMADEVTTERIKEWMNSLAELSPLTRNSYRLVVHAMFSFAVSEGYCVTNPVARVPVFAIPQTTPNILTVEQAQSLMEKARETDQELGLLAYVTLALFAGLRSSELAWLYWLDAKLDRQMVTVDGQIAKTGSIRNVALHENAQQWLALCVNKSGRIAPKNLNRRLRRLRFLAGIEQWHGNEFRHSFGSYHFDLYQDAAKTSAQLGHHSGTQILFTHYRSLVNLGAGERYFGIRPVREPQQLMAGS